MSFFEKMYGSVDSYADMENYQPRKLKILKRIALQYIDSRDYGLDIGIGRSSLLKEIGFGKMYGIDLTDENLDYQRKQGVVCWKKDVNEGLPKEILKDTYDLIICSEVLEHLLTGDRLLQDAAEVMTSKSFLLITVPNEIGFYVRKLRILLFNQIYGTTKNVYQEQHLRFFNKQILYSLLSSAGFRVVKFTGYNLSRPTSRWGLLGYIPGKNLLARIWPSLFATNLVIVARLRRYSNE